jgi:hypothetical protein
MSITIPGDRLVGTPTPPPITVTPNANAKFTLRAMLADVTDFKNFADAVNAGERSISANMTANITLPSSADFLPIAKVTGTPSPNMAYTGVFNGMGFTLSYSLSGSSSYLALFGINNGTIMNLIVAGSVTAIKDAAGTPIDYIAGVVAYNDIGGLITRVISKVAINAVGDEAHCIGGIAGFNGWDGNNTDSPHYDPENPGSYQTGGIIKQCRNEGAVAGGFNKIGGIVGENAWEIIECANIGPVTVHKDGRGWPGGAGIGGRNGNNDTATEQSHIRFCYNLADIIETDPMGNAENAFGNIAGWCDALGKIIGCYAAGQLPQHRGTKNPVVGMIDGGAPIDSENNYALNTIYKTSDQTALIGIPKDEAYMKSQAFVDEINAAIESALYALNTDGGFPKLAWETGPLVIALEDVSKKN